MRSSIPILPQGRSPATPGWHPFGTRRSGCLGTEKQETRFVAGFLVYSGGPIRFSLRRTDSRAGTPGGVVATRRTCGVGRKPVTAYGSTVTRKNVAGIAVASSLVFCSSKRLSSSACRSPSRPSFVAASNAFMVGP